jgi:hypothetical protein
MGLVLGRRSGVLLAIVCGPGLALLVLFLLLAQMPRVFQRSMRFVGGRPVRLLALSRPNTALGDFLAETHLDQLPLIFDLIAGRIELACSWCAQSHLTIMLALPAMSDQPASAMQNHATSVARTE